VSTSTHESAHATHTTSHADPLLSADHKALLRIDYGSEKIFAERYPGLVKIGLRCSWEGIDLMFNDKVPRELAWGYYAEHAHWMRYEVAPHPGYEQLRALCATKDTWVVTSNADGLFERSGFPSDRIYLP
jgi:hypothetical protein